jgi:hypothetical protein
LYAHVTKKTTELKRTRIAEGFNLFAGLLGTVPASLQAFIGTIANTSMPVFNIVCTNVPGPQAPLYVLGKRMTHSYPYVPIAYTVGLTVAIFSYDQKLFFSLTGDAKSLPDLEQLKLLLDQSFAELREAAGVPEPRRQVVEAPATAGSDSLKPSQTAGISLVQKKSDRSRRETTAGYK